MKNLYINRSTYTLFSITINAREIREKPRVDNVLLNDLVPLEVLIEFTYRANHTFTYASVK